MTAGLWSLLVINPVRFTTKALISMGKVPVLINTLIYQSMSTQGVSEQWNIDHLVLPFWPSVEHITRGAQVPENLHLLLMDMHKSLNNIQNRISTENIAYVMTYDIQEQDKHLIQAPMSKVNVNAPLKSDHTDPWQTATRTNGRDIVIQECGRDDISSLYGRKTIPDGVSVKKLGFDCKH